MIYQSVDQSDFVEAFKNMNREENFSINARRELFDYYNELSNDMGEDIELDVIAMCCEWSEYSEDELISDYKHIVDSGVYDNEDDMFDALLEELPDHTTLIEVGQYGEPNTYLVMEF